MKVKNNKNNKCNHNFFLIGTEKPQYVFNKKKLYKYYVRKCSKCGKIVKQLIYNKGNNIFKSNFVFYE